MSVSGSFSHSFSGGSFTTSSSRGLRKRKNSSAAQHAPRRRRRGADFKRTDGEEDIDEDLCTRCRAIDFEAILEIEPNETVTEHGVNVCDLGEIAPFSRDTVCKLCTLFALILSRNQQYEPPWGGSWHLRAFTTGTLRNRSHAAASRAQDLSIVIALSRKQEVLSKSDNVECIDRGVIMPWHNHLELGSDDQGACRVVACPRRIKFDRLKGMLSSCDEEHLKCRERQETKIPFPVRARVIDCVTREVIPLNSSHTYLALSYVWGPRKPETLEYTQGSKLSESLPTTIEDAVSITEALGFRYLWVDRYCVDQSQNGDTQHQVAQMGSIYSHAYVTICALGDHDEVGFPGVSLDRKRQIRVQTQDLILSWTGPSIRRNLEFSKWRSRGWTYQESVLSRRSLFFTDHFVALNCDSENANENISSNYFHTWSFNKESELYGDATSRGRVLYPAQAFDKHLQEFQKRQLSYVADTLSAFKGILSQLSVQSYWGIPIYMVSKHKRINLPDLDGRELETGFIAGLCWKVRDSSHTSAPDRDDFPSWSWVGQKYARSFDNYLARSYQLEVAQAHFSVFQPTIRVKGTDDKSISLQELSGIHSADTATTTKILPEQTRFLEVRSVMIRWTRQVNPQRTTGWASTGLDAYQVGENGWWKSDFIGRLYLDPTYDHDVSSTKLSHDKCDRRDRVCGHLPLKSGAAVLLALNVKAAGDHTVVRAVWLVVRQVKGGSYRRRGVIVSNQSVKSRSPIKAPTEGVLESILLG